MSTHEKETFFETYGWTDDWRKLPWSHEEPSLFLAEIGNQYKPGTALDIGCGAGTDSIFLAKQGWDVTSLDFMPKALEYTQQRAAEIGVSVTPLEADITEWEPDQTYDLVLDHGLLHNMDPVRHVPYRERIMKAVADDGNFVLLHWHPRFPGQADGKMGPRRVDREAIKAFFAPELQERFYAREEFEDLPEFVGGGMTQAYYWFQRNQVELKPAELIEQIKATLTKHDVDFESLIKEAGDELIADNVSPQLMCRILGPGRFGISHVIPEPDAVDGLLAAYADKAGQSTRYVENLVRVFASEQLGNICIANARCTECSVSFCKRLRYR